MVCVSETYKYRARAKPYNAAPADKEWSLDDSDTPKPKPLAKRYTDNMKGILDTVMSDSTVSESSIRFEKNEKDKHKHRIKKLKAIKGSELVIKHAETSDKYDKISDIPEKEKFEDDGYSQLTVHEYIACRTIPQHKLIQDKLPEINSRKNYLQILMYVMSAVSVMLATMNMDLYIAISVSETHMTS